MKKITYLVMLVTGLIVFLSHPTLLYAGADKMQICHKPPGSPDNYSTIVVNENALSAHMAHGDSLGTCDEEPPDDSGGGGGLCPCSPQIEAQGWRVAPLISQSCGEPDLEHRQTTEEAHTTIAIGHDTTTGDPRFVAVTDSKQGRLCTGLATDSSVGAIADCYNYFVDPACDG